MKTGAFTSAVDQAKVVEAIAAAERLTSGEVRVVISRQTVEDPVAEAQREFQRLGLNATRERNAVLVFVAPRSQRFAIIGDEGIHRHCGEGFWAEVAAILSTQFRAGDFTGGLVEAINRAGALLATHFPRQGDDVNELPNDVVER